ncbi:MAG: ABC-F family ATP-binding cassette domain-containing protein [Lachnospiraceae bacterium]|nr:ABC-F family ATP-binding cassette domain-containing protein [Lachnospiraceae bacterium]
MTLEGIGISFGENELLRSVTQGIEDRDRIGVIGINGTGKSTLLAIAAGTLEPDEGQIIRRNGLKISYLPQNPAFDPDRTILENVVRNISREQDFWNTRGEAAAMLQKLGIDDPEALPGTLSGGQKKRAALAAALLTPSDLLILDEPTNHLDHEMIEWLEEWLGGYSGALIMITHDRYFLDEVTSVIWEIDRARVYSYPGNYEKYLETKQARLDFALAEERKMAALYKQDLAWMMRGARARSTKQKAHIQRFEALRDREKIVEERNVVLESLPSRMGNKTIEIRHISKSYGEKCLFRDFSYNFLKNDRIGIIGPNGCGKSTLLRILTGKVSPDEGELEIGQTIKMSCFSQENEGLPPAGTVIELVKEHGECVRTADGLITASAMCERFLFPGSKQYTPVEKLSGGEKRRLYLLRVLMEAPNVLILDEPTNDLDIETLQILEDYLDHFSGIVIAVSHDRYFLDRVVNRIFSFEGDGYLHQSEGGYEEYLLHKEGLSLSSLSENAKAAPKEAGKGARCRKAEAPRRLSYSQQREYDSIEGLIDSLTEKSERLAEEMNRASADYVKLQSLSEEKQKTDAELEEKIGRFLELQELVESFQKNG